MFAIGYALGGIVHAEHHRDAAFARQRGQMRRAAAEFSDNAGDTGKNAAQRRSRDLGHENVAWTNARQFTFATDDTSPACPPADAGWLAVEFRVTQPDLIWYVSRPGVERAGLEKSNSLI